MDAHEEPECRYPVMVTVTHQHVVWIGGETAKDALERLQNDGEWYEHLKDNETLADVYEEMREPDRYDWDHVYGSYGNGSYDGLRCDAHVRTHESALFAAKRAAEKAACEAAGHPNLEIRETDKHESFCRSCGWLKLTTLLAEARTRAGAP